MWDLVILQTQQFFILVAGLARYHKFKFIKMLTMKEMGAHEKFLELQVPGVITISTKPMI